MTQTTFEPGDGAHSMPSKRQVLPEFIAIRIPTRDRQGTLLPTQVCTDWRERIKQFLLRELDIVGLEEDRTEGLWRGEYDPQTDRFQVVTEECLVVRSFCTAEQRAAFESRGEELLLEMCSALDQEAVAYETREGLIILQV